MSSSAANKPLELDAVMRSIRPHVKTPDAANAANAPTAAPVAAPAAAPAVVAPRAEPQAPIERVERDEARAEPVMQIAPASRKPRRAERVENRVQVDVVPATGEATVGVYMRLPKSVHQQLKTVVFQNELTEQGLQSIADITREAITDWLARNASRSAAA